MNCVRHVDFDERFVLHRGGGRNTEVGNDRKSRKEIELLVSGQAEQGHGPIIVLVMARVRQNGKFS